jgi:hypothetical protein
MILGIVIGGVIGVSSRRPIWGHPMVVLSNYQFRGRGPEFTKKGCSNQVKKASF